MTVLTENATIRMIEVPEIIECNQVVLIRGLPGSGKTSLANMINPIGNVFRAATDDWFLDNDGKYEFNPSDLVVNHQACLDWFKDRVLSSEGNHTIVVHNTFSMFWELHPYISFTHRVNSDQHGTGKFRINVIDKYDDGLSDEELAKRNTHGVNHIAIGRMRERLKKSRWSWEKYDMYVDGIEENGHRWL